MQAQAEHDQLAQPTPQGGAAPQTLRIWLLGGFRISVGSRSIAEEEWHLKKAGSLLKLFALSPAHRLHREQVMELLWPDLDPKSALNNLHVARRTLEPSASAGAASGYLHLRDESLAFSPEQPVWVDAEAFEQAASAARNFLEPAAFRAAIDLYSGELLPQDRYEAWAEERRVQLRGVYLSLLLELAALYEERKEYREAIEVLGRVVAEDPTKRERMRGSCECMHSWGGEGRPQVSTSGSGMPSSGGLARSPRRRPHACTRRSGLASSHRPPASRPKKWLLPLLREPLGGTICPWSVPAS